MATKKTARKQISAISRDLIVNFLDTELRTDQIKDSSCNGLQVQGTETIKKVGLVVDACLASYVKAVEHGCQMIIAHHGIIWDGIKNIRGPIYNQIKFLIDNSLNLYAAHLPLDLHPVYGNNAQLCSLLGLKKIKSFGNYHGTDIGFEGEFEKAVSVNSIAGKLTKELSGLCTVLPFGPEKIKRIAVVSGGAGGELTEAIEKGIDCYVTGEPVHHNYHQALEAHINVIYCGHYHSEKGGVQAIGKLLESKFGIKAEFLDIPTIV